MNLEMMWVVFKDNGFMDDATKINVKENPEISWDWGFCGGLVNRERGYWSVFKQATNKRI